MMGAKFDIEKLDGTGDFGLWRIKMSALLIQHGCEAALEVLPANMEAQTNAELNLKSHSAVILCLGNKVLREVIDEFNKINLDLANIEVKFKDEDLALLLLTSLPASYEHFVDTLLYGREALTLEDVMATLNLKEIKERSKVKGNNGEELYAREYLIIGIHVSQEESQYQSLEALLDWIMDSGCSYHMTPRLDIFFDFLECDGGSVQLGDNRECKIKGIGKVRTQLRDGSSFVLHNVRYILELKKNLISLGTLEKEGFTVKLQSGIVKVINGSMVVLSGIRRDNCIYSLDGHVMAGRHSTQGVIDYVYSDLWGPSQVESLGGKRSPSTAIEKNTHTEMWSGHPSDYVMLRIFGCVVYSHDKQGKLEPRAIKYVLLGYPEGVKGYRLYRLDDESPKIVTSRNVVFNPSVMYKDTLKDSGVGADKSVKKLQVKVELQRLNNHTPEEDQTDQEDGDDEDEGDQETDQTTNLTDYQLARDREPRTRTKLLRFRDESNMAAYAFIVAQEEETHEPLTYQEAVAYEDSSKWKLSCHERRDGFSEEEQDLGVSRSSNWAKAIQYTDIWVILALTACKDYELEQLDVKTAFLHGNLEEVIYMREPLGYEQGNKRSSYDSCVYYRSYALGEYIYLLLYADDMLIACKRKDVIGSTKSLLKKEFHIKELREVKKILGMEVIKDQSRKILRVSQSGYVSKILNNFRIDNGKSVKMPLGRHFKLSLKDYPVRDCDVKRMSKVPYANAVGSLMYLMVCTRLDISYAAVKETIWLRGLLEELGVELNTVAVNCDNQGVIHLSWNHVFYERTKHINVRYHFIREVVDAKTVKVLKVGTIHNAVDALTKVVPELKLQHCLELLNVGVG
nr:retrotransposon protein, putative, Ty1-copia subclass [Tanacetum cinerariifolium]